MWAGHFYPQILSFIGVINAFPLLFIFLSEVSEAESDFSTFLLCKNNSSLSLVEDLLTLVVVSKEHKR
jgi:hypothetical protein